MTVHPTAIVHPNATIHETADVGPFCLIGSDHGPLKIGPFSIIRSHTIIEGGSTYGSHLETGHAALLRTGNEAGINLRIGSHSRLEGEGEIGDYVRIHGDCEMTKGTLRHFSRLYGGSYVTDNRLPPSDVNVNAVLDEGAVVCMNSVVIASVRVGVGAFVGASTVISRDVPDAMALVGGKLRPVDELTWMGYSYPWTAYYINAYPVEARARLHMLHQRIMETLAEMREPERRQDDAWAEVAR